MGGPAAAPGKPAKKPVDRLPTQKMRGLAWQKIQPRLLEGTIWEDEKFEKGTVKVRRCVCFSFFVVDCSIVFER